MGKIDGVRKTRPTPASPSGRRRFVPSAGVAEPIAPPQREHPQRASFSPIPPQFPPASASGGNEKGGFPLRVVLGAVFVVFLLVGVWLHMLHRAWVTLSLEEITLSALVPLPEQGASSSTRGEEGSVSPSSEDADNPSAVSSLLRPFEIELTRETIVSAQGTEHRESYAQGEVEVRNYWSKSPLPLVAKTRFEAPNGMVFRSLSPVQVPGYQQEADGTIVPGTARVRVVASEVGEEGNVPRGTPFLLPAFKGRPQYERVSAVAVDDFSGGFEGEVPKVEEDTLRELAQNLTQTIAAQLAKQPELRKVLGDQFVLVEGSAEVKVISYEGEALGGGGARLTFRVRARGWMFNPREVTLALFPNAPKNATIQRVSARLEPNGRQVRLIAVAHPEIDPDAFARGLAGKPRAALQEVAFQLPAGVQKVSARIFPFWRSTFPTDPRHIYLTVAYVPADEEN